MKSIILIYIPCPDKKTAKQISLHLLKKRLIACTNMFPIEDTYWWEGRIHSGKEVVLIAKTTANKYTAVKKEVEGIHPYEVPCIMKLPAEVNDPYGTWMRQEIS